MAWLFSGWNWVAKIFPDHTLEAKVMPYSVVVAIMAGSAGTG
jgi:hypothetical protein